LDVLDIKNWGVRAPLFTQGLGRSADRWQIGYSGAIGAKGYAIHALPEGFRNYLHSLLREKEMMSRMRMIKAFR